MDFSKNLRIFKEMKKKEIIHCWTFSFEFLSKFYWLYFYQLIICNRIWEFVLERDKIIPKTGFQFIKQQILRKVTDSRTIYISNQSSVHSSSSHYYFPFNVLRMLNHQNAQNDSKTKQSKKEWKTNRINKAPEI